MGEQYDSDIISIVELLKLMTKSWKVEHDGETNDIKIIDVNGEIVCYFENKGTPESLKRNLDTARFISTFRNELPIIMHTTQFIRNQNNEYEKRLKMLYNKPLHLMVTWTCPRCGYDENYWASRACRRCWGEQPAFTGKPYAKLKPGI